MIPNLGIMSAVPNAMEKSFVMVSTPRTNSKRGHISMVEKRKSRDNIMTSKPNKEFIFFWNI